MNSHKTANTHLRSPFPYCVLVILMGACGYVQAQDSATTSQLETNQAPQTNEPASDRKADLRESIESYRRALNDLSGIYDQSTSELYLSLASAYSELEEFQQAGSAYNEALQSLRISDGLYSELQLRVLSQYTADATLAEDWIQVDNNLYLAHMIARQIYAKTDPRYVEQASRFASWKIRAYQYQLYERGNEESVQEAVEVYTDLIAALSPDTEDYHSTLARYSSAKGLAHYYSALYLESIDWDDFPGVGVDTINQQVCHQEVEIVNGRQVTRTVCENRRMPNPDYFESRVRARNSALTTSIASMRSGFAEAIEIIEAKPNVTVEEIAIAILNLGDINFLVQDFRRANDQYGRVEELLNTRDVPESLRLELIGRPRKIMQGILADLPIDGNLAREAATGVVSFDLSAEGGIRNVSITGSGADIEEANRAVVMKKLQRSIYRPVIAQGEAINSHVVIAASDL